MTRRMARHRNDAIAHFMRAAHDMALVPVTFSSSEDKPSLTIC